MSDERVDVEPKPKDLEDPDGDDEDAMTCDITVSEMGVVFVERPVNPDLGTTVKIRTLGLSWERIYDMIEAEGVDGTVDTKKKEDLS